METINLLHFDSYKKANEFNCSIYFSYFSSGYNDISNIYFDIFYIYLLNSFLLISFAMICLIIGVVIFMILKLIYCNGKIIVKNIYALFVFSFIFLAFKSYDNISIDNYKILQNDQMHISKYDFNGTKLLRELENINNKSEFNYDNTQSKCKFIIINNNCELTFQNYLLSYIDVDQCLNVHLNDKLINDICFIVKYVKKLKSFPILIKKCRIDDINRYYFLNKKVESNFHLNRLFLNENENDEFEQVNFYKVYLDFLFDIIINLLNIY